MIRIKIENVGARAGVMTISNHEGEHSASFIFNPVDQVIHMTKERRNREWAKGLILRGEDGEEYFTAAGFDIIAPKGPTDE